MLEWTHSFGDEIFRPNCLSVEAHMSPQEDIRVPHDANIEHNGGVRVTHIVIRFEHQKQRRFSESLVDSMLMHIAHFPSLETVTLEAYFRGSPGIAEKLSLLLRETGRVRQRTCAEARKIAKKAIKDPARYSEENGVASPLWYSKSDKMVRDREVWLTMVLRCVTALQF